MMMFVKKIDKKAIAIIMCIALLLSAVPTIAAAAGGAKDISNEVASAAAGEVISVTGDCELDMPVLVSNGTAESPVIINVADMSTLTIQDGLTVSGALVIKGAGSVKRGGDGDMITVKSGGSLELAGIALDGSYDSDKSGAVVFAGKGSSLSIKDGTSVTGNIAEDKAAVCAETDTAISGEISVNGNTDKKGAPANIMLAHGSRFVVSGEISGDIYAGTDASTGTTVAAGNGTYAMSEKDAAAITFAQPVIFDAGTLRTAERCSAPQFTSSSYHMDAEDGLSATLTLSAPVASGVSFSVYDSADGADQALETTAALSGNELKLAFKNAVSANITLYISARAEGFAESERTTVELVPFEKNATTPSTPSDPGVAFNGANSYSAPSVGGLPTVGENMPEIGSNDGNNDGNTANNSEVSGETAVKSTAPRNPALSLDLPDTLEKAQSMSIEENTDDADTTAIDDTTDDPGNADTDDTDGTGAAVRTTDDSFANIWYISIIGCCALAIFIVLFRCTAAYAAIVSSANKRRRG